MYVYMYVCVYVCMHVCMYVGRAGERSDKAGQHVQVFTNSRYRPGNSRSITMKGHILITVTTFALAIDLLQPFTQDLKLTSFTNPFLHSLSDDLHGS